MSATTRQRAARGAIIPLAYEAVDISAADHDFADKRVVELVIGTTGDVKVDMAGLAAAVTIPSAVVAAKGGVLVGHFTKVYKVGTTGSSIGAFYY